MPPTVTELMTETIKTAFIPEKAAGVDTVIQFKFTGSQTHPSPKMTMTVDSDDYVKMSIGEMDATMAFLKGKVKVAGDMSVALKMGQYFKYGK